MDLVLVEGESDAAVVRVLAARLGLEDVPIRASGGATGTRRTIAALPDRPDRVLALCDEREAPVVLRALTGDDAVFVCRADLEDELIRALGVDAVLDVLETTGDLRSFRTLQGQPQHRDSPAPRQLHRFIAAGAGRKARIDEALAAALPIGEEPPPLRALLTRIGPDRRHAGHPAPPDGASPDGL